MLNPLSLKLDLVCKCFVVFDLLSKYSWCYHQYQSLFFFHGSQKYASSPLKLWWKSWPYARLEKQQYYGFIFCFTHQPEKSKNKWNKNHTNNWNTSRGTSSISINTNWFVGTLQGQNSHFAGIMGSNPRVNGNIPQSQQHQIAYSQPLLYGNYFPHFSYANCPIMWHPPKLRSVLI